MHLGELRVAIGLADHAGTHREPGPAQQGRHLVGLTALEVERDLVAERLASVRQLVAHLESEEHVAARCQHPAELGERVGQAVVRHVDRGVPGQDPAEGAVGQVESQHRAHLEAQFWVLPPRRRDHLRGQVDPRCLQPQAGQQRGHPAGAAPDVGHRAAGGGPHEFGERAQHGPVQRPVGQLVTEPLGVVGGHGVIRAPGGAHEIWLRHR
jgi:hypothetical protein